MKNYRVHIYTATGDSEEEFDASSLQPWNGKGILLVDLDAFFASVEQLDHPEWRGKPVIVGGSPTNRGVVSTASYEARVFGVHSAMPSSTAQKLCPDAIWTGGNFHRYREMSRKVMDILYDESPHLMQVSIDEAFLDVTPNRTNTDHPIAIAQRIQRRVDELGITCSIGVGTSKSVAKIASDQNKPHGISAIYPGDETNFLFPLPVKTMSGIGASAQAKLLHYGIRTLGDLAHADLELLKSVFGKNASLMRDRAKGIDTEVDDSRAPVKSVSNEISLSKSTADRSTIEGIIATMAHKVGRRLRKKTLEGTTLHLKIRYEDLTIRTCQRKIPSLGVNDLTWLPHLYSMLNELWHDGQLVRLVGVGVSGFEREPLQESLFGSLRNDERSYGTLVDHAKDNEALLRASDSIAEKFGEGALRFGHELKTYKNTTGSSSKNPEDYRD